ncbi:unnamed protein product [Didymodactylos carnosus]|uniref:EF-hand domain-containing protein n=1 Tax=Didymodactylos carnosus TaxID=1234261 RepID=A0A815G513_9BILA|nr:unnamed protein product [Didymodactylos carnosus]CAF4189855.1 unnamed protein product [Didymodactylos carnosus]
MSAGSKEGEKTEGRIIARLSERQGSRNLQPKSSLLAMLTRKEYDVIFHGNKKSCNKSEVIQVATTIHTVNDAQHDERFSKTQHLSQEINVRILDDERIKGRNTSTAFDQHVSFPIGRTFNEISMKVLKAKNGTEKEDENKIKNKSICFLYKNKIINDHAKHVEDVMSELTNERNKETFLYMLLIPIREKPSEMPPLEQVLYELPHERHKLCNHVSITDSVIRTADKNEGFSKPISPKKYHYNGQNPGNAFPLFVYYQDVIIELKDIQVGDHVQLLRNKSLKQLKMEESEQDKYDLYYHGYLLELNKQLSEYRDSLFNTDTIIIIDLIERCREEKSVQVESLSTFKKSNSDRMEYNFSYDYQALLLFVRLSLQSIIFSDEYEDRFERYYAYCDRDKSGHLDLNEMYIGLLTVLKLVDDVAESHRYLIPIDNEHDGKLDKVDFKCLLVDMLTEYFTHNKLNYFQKNDEKVNMSEAYTNAIHPFLNKVNNTVKDKMDVPTREDIEAIPYYVIKQKIFDIKRDKKLVQKKHNEAELDLLTKNAYVMKASGNTDKQGRLINRAYHHYIESKGTNREVVLAVISLCLYIFVIFIHPCIPYISRKHFTKDYPPSTGSRPWFVKSIEFSYIYIGGISYSIFLGMIVYAVVQYGELFNELNSIMLRVTNDERFVELGAADYLNLRQPNNLNLFLAQVRRLVAKTNKSEYRTCLSTITYALILDLILGLTAIIRLLIYGLGESIDLLTSFSLIDICILTITIVIFLIIVVFFNHTTTHHILQLLKRTKKEAVCELLLKKDNTIEDRNIQYLSTVIEYLEAAKAKYSVKLFGLIVDRALLLKIVTVLLTGGGSGLFSLLQKDKK